MLACWLVRSGFLLYRSFFSSEKSSILLLLCRREGVVQAKIFRSSTGLREWLETNHDRVPRLWLGFYNKRADKKSITYREALDEALCFGWIDGVRKSISETTYKQRFTPRKPKSYWSAVNIGRGGELAPLGRIAPSGAKRSSNARATPVGILSSHDRNNCLSLTGGSSKLPPVPGNSSGHRRPGTSGHPVFGS
jgi:hypothetical protein